MYLGTYYHLFCVEPVQKMFFFYKYFKFNGFFFLTKWTFSFLKEIKTGGKHFASCLQPLTGGISIGILIKKSSFCIASIPTT